MAFFDELTKKAQLVAGAAAEKAKDLAETATEKAKAATDAARVNMEILSEQREIEKNYRAIGEWFVSEFQGEVPDAVKDVVAAVNASKAPSPRWRPRRLPSLPLLRPSRRRRKRTLSA
jgi:hypothetical protein